MKHDPKKSAPVKPEAKNLQSTTVFQTSTEATNGEGESRLAVIEANLVCRQAALETRESEHAQRVKRENDEIETARRQIFLEQERLAKRIEVLHGEEAALRLAELARDTGFAEARRAFAAEVDAERARVREELVALRQKRVLDLEAEIEAERNRRFSVLATEIRTDRERHIQALADEKRQADMQIAAERAESDARVVALDEREAPLHEKYELLRLREMQLSAKERFNEDVRAALDDEIESRIEERRISFERAEGRLREECERLRASLNRSDELLGLYKELEHRLGDEPEAVLLRLSEQEEELQVLRTELLNRPSDEIRERFADLQTENERLHRELKELSNDNRQLTDQFRETSELQYAIALLETEKRHLQQRNELLDSRCELQHAELVRLKGGFERESEREKRVGLIETPIIADPPALDTSEPVGEIEWLDRIDAACRRYGLGFNRRILHAFHTCLKTAEWSPLTVLAGVSGTGKSELPRLYSHFGGINFMNVPVQPNWDSPQSLLGFFNTIDNTFDAQPLLRLLVQAQQKASPGLHDAMTLVLLDEMNLAHVELYFADFLSKLEQRRGCGIDRLPSINVQLGARVDPYDLKLGRNVLWAGTMNQDETTKALSDKVLDRGFVIHFPSPTKFERRRRLRPLESPAPLLPSKTWFSWSSQETGFTDDEIRPYKDFMEGLNDDLGAAGRALGHRVWQSIEYYMANYPDVRKAKEALKTEPDALGNLTRAMKIAFEDQLVLKVMPKLRGIETRGKSRDKCLDRIARRLDEGNYAIGSDFRRACEVGYGQFIWSSAEYLSQTDDEPVLIE